MADTIYLSPSLTSVLTPECKALLSGLGVEILDEDLRPKTAAGTVYVARYRNWLPEPQPRIRRIAPTGAETVLLTDGTAYTVDYAAGVITLVSPTTDLVRADYFFSPLNDALLERLMAASVSEVSVLIARPIDPLDIHPAYRAAVCKRLYTNVLKNLLIEARNYFAVSVAGRSISKDHIPSNIDLMIKENETQLQAELNWLRHFNTTKRLE